jgi:hypothetical protein
MILLNLDSNLIIREENHSNAFMVVQSYFCSMLPTMHLLISLGIAFCLEVRYQRKYSVILLLGVIGVMPDIDHLFSLYQNAGLFHNTLFLGVLPLAVLIFSNLVETNRRMDSSAYQRFFIGVTVVLLGHLMLDLIAGNEISLGLTSAPLTFGIASVPLVQSGVFGTLFSTTDLLCLLLFALVVSGNIVLKKVYAISEGYEVDEEVVAKRNVFQSVFKRPVKS